MSCSVFPTPSSLPLDRQHRAPSLPVTRLETVRQLSAPVPRSQPSRTHARETQKPRPGLNLHRIQPSGSLIIHKASVREAGDAVSKPTIPRFHQPTMAGATLDEVKQLVLAQQAMIARMDSESRQNRVVVNRLEAHMVQERKQKLTEQAAKDAAEAAAAKTARPPKRGSLDTHGASTKRLETSGALDLSAPY